MANNPTQFKVVRAHEGDRSYAVGDVRDGRYEDLKHLIPKVLQPIEGKAEAAPQNKAERPPKNKARKATSKKRR